MQTYAFKMKLNPRMAKEYKHRHDYLWTELKVLLKEAGISNYCIHLDEETNILFAHLQRPTGHSMDDLPSHPLMKKWWRYMADIMETNPDSSPKVTELKTLFELK